MKVQIDEDHAIFYMGDYAKDIIKLVEKISNWNKITPEDRQDVMDTLLSYYIFDNGDMLVGDIMLERNQIIADSNISKDALIALARKGIVVIQKKGMVNNG